jgi:hypothetical protein
VGSSARVDALCSSCISASCSLQKYLERLTAALNEAGQSVLMLMKGSKIPRIELNTVQWRTQEFCSEGVQQIQLRTEDRENGDLGAVAP